jgi:imidazolonepropionase-like amidohydrolase
MKQPVNRLIASWPTAKNGEPGARPAIVVRSIPRAVAILAVLCLVVPASFGADTPDDADTPDGADRPRPLVVKAQTVYVGNGRSISPAVVLIRAGRIEAVGSDVAVPDGAEVLEVAGGCLTPGLIDANARIEAQDMIAPRRRWSAGDAAAEADQAAPLTGLQPDAVSDRGSGPPADGLPGHVEEDDQEHEHDTPWASGVQNRSVIAEQSSEVVPHIRVLDALELGSRDFQRLARGGVTTIYASPDASAMIGPRGAVLHTAGPPAARVLQAVAAVKATIGSEPGSLGTYNRPPSRSSSDLYNRRPNSRMGLVWVFRKSFYDAIRCGQGLQVYGADTADAEAHGVLLEVLQGRVPLRIQARAQRDILTALRLAEEFQLTFTLEEATEAYRCLDEIKATGTRVIFGPIYDQPSGIRAGSRDGERSRYYTFRALLERGIPTALSAHEFRDEDGLARQAMYAQRFGVGFDDALRAVTLTPAELLGLDDRLGTVEVGKRADLVLWSGRPLAADSLPVLVLIEGQVVVDRRSD